MLETETPNPAVEPGQDSKVGSLIVIGLGISPGQVTLDAIKAIRSADVVFSLTSNPVSQHMLENSNPDVRSMHGCYAAGKPRSHTYKEITDHVLAEVRNGKNVCFALYGHPGIFADPSHESIRIAREEGYDALMLPGVSADACLFADLGLDPGVQGCQSFEATDFLYRERSWDPFSILILWQISVLGVRSLPDEDEKLPGLPMLQKMLTDKYGGGHMGILYESPCYPLCVPRAQRKALEDLEPADFNPETTLVVLPLRDNPRRNEDFVKVVR